MTSTTRALIAATTALAATIGLSLVIDPHATPEPDPCRRALARIAIDGPGLDVAPEPDQCASLTSEQKTEATTGALEDYYEAVRP